MLLFITNTQKPIIQGKIEKIYFNTNSITIYLENSDTEIIIFKKFLNLQENQTIQVFGKEDTYNGQKQIIANKIIILK